MWINFVCLLVLICGLMSKFSTFPSSSRFMMRVVVRCARASGWRCSCWNTNWHWQWKMFKNVNVNDVPGRLSANLQPNQKVVWVPQVFRFYFRDRDCLSNLQRCKCQPELNAIWAKWVIAKPWIIANKKLFASCRWTFLLKWSQLWCLPSLVLLCNFRLNFVVTFK